LKLTIVVPTYNEAENIPRLADVLLTLPVPQLNMLIVDDNSPDGTGKIADNLKRRTGGRVDVLHRAGKLGLGTAYTTGFAHALQKGAEAVAQMDADFSHPPEKIVEMIEKLGSCDVVLGSRYVRGGKLDENWPVWRKGLSAFGNFYARTILGMKLRDVTGGFRMWHAYVLEHMPLAQIRSSGYVFQVEMAYVAARLGYQFAEIPIYFAERRVGKSKMNLRIQLEAALRVWQLAGIYRHIKPVR
jgi:dolichol-phosphate mannosyltransferase